MARLRLSGRLRGERHQHSSSTRRKPCMVALALALALLALLPAGAAGFLTPRLPPTSGRTPRAAAGACAMACEQTRRQFLHASCGGGAGTVVALQIIAPGATAAAEEEEEEEEDDDDRDASTAEQPGVPKLKLFSRFGKGQLKTLGPAGPLGPPEAIAPDWLEGDWDVTFKFRQATFPLTKDFAQFKQLLAGSIRSPGDAPGVATTTVLSWRSGPKAVEEDRAANLKNYYNAWSKDLTVDGQKGSRTRKVAWMPILTQRGVYEKVNSVSVSGANEFRMVVKEIAPDLSVVGTAPLEGVVVNRKSELAGNAFVVSELYRIKRLSQGKVKMVETGTGDTEVVTAFVKKNDDEITGNHRVLVYLVPFSGPAGDKYGDSAGGAVAVYDYAMTMTRK